MSPKVVDKDERQRAILAAATSVFARKGYAASRIEDVAQEAGVAKGTIYLYFDSRDAILLAAFEAFETDLFAGMREVLETDAPALVRLRAIVRAALESVEAAPELARVVLDFWAAGVFESDARDDGRSRIDVGKVYAKYRYLVGSLLEEGKREGTVRRDLAEETSAVIVGALEGVALQWILDPGAVSLERMAVAVLDTLINGLRERSAAA